MTRSLVLRAPMHYSGEQRGVLARWDRSVVVTDRSREHSGSFLGARNLLAAPLLLRWRWTERVPPRGHAPWGQGAFLRGRRRRRLLILAPCMGWRVKQREGPQGGAPCGTDELGDAGKPVLVEVVDGAIVHEFPRQEQ